MTTTLTKCCITESRQLVTNCDQLKIGCIHARQLVTNCYRLKIPLNSGNPI